MTAMDRTRKLLLEIAGTRAGMEEAKQYSVEDFRQFLAEHNVDLDPEAIERVLDDLCAVRCLEWRVTDDIRYRITAWGRMLVAKLDEKEVA